MEPYPFLSKWFTQVFIFDQIGASSTMFQYMDNKYYTLKMQFFVVGFSWCAFFIANYYYYKLESYVAMVDYSIAK